MIKIVFKNRDVVIILKDSGMPSQPDPTGDENALESTKKLLFDMGEPSDLWLVHRLDRVVGGLLAFARNKASAASLSEQFGSSFLEKEYLAVVPSDIDSGELSDYIFKDARLGKAFTVDSARKGAKYAELRYKALSKVETEKGIYTLVSVSLKTGRFHQIRVQFASRGMPLVGDGKYGSRDNRAKMPALFASRLSFNLKKERIEAEKKPDASLYPWSLFEAYIKADD